MTKRTLVGSERHPFPGAKHLGSADGNEQIDVTLILRRADEAGFQTHLAALSQSGTGIAPLTAASSRIETGNRHTADVSPLSREAYAKQYGAAESDIDAIRTFATQQQLHVTHVDACSRTVVLSGSIAQFNALFSVDLQQYQHSAGTFRGRTGTIDLPEELAASVTAVLGLDNRPQANAHRLLAPVSNKPPMRPALGQPKLRAYTPMELATLYDFPEGDGAGQCIGIIELGGGYSSADLQAYFTGLGITAPNVVAVSVNGIGNAPSSGQDSPDGEVMLDIEIAGALAPKATLAVYFASNSDAGFVGALNKAIHDSIHRPSVISLSWGSPEINWTAQALAALNDVLQSAATLGVTVCVASGDSGSSDGVNDGADHVDFPASSPYSLACGGTRLSGTGSVISAETVWNDGAQGGAGGGGVSTQFALPSWQQGLTVKHSNGSTAKLAKRGVPDVAGNADPESGYRILVHGEATVVGGTSAVAPLWAGLIARINANRSTPLGYMNPRLYQQANVCRDITQGDNGGFSAASGWDACTGLGSPDGKKLANLN